MDEFETWVAQEVRDAVNVWSTTTDRAEQDKQFIIGPSAIGFCSERLRRQLDRQEPSDEVDWNKAFIGTAVGDYLERAMTKRWPSSMSEVPLKIDLEGDVHRFTVPGNADLLIVDEGIVWDFKTKDGLDWIRRAKEPDQGYQYQRHLYAHGAIQAGLFPDHKPEEVRVGNIYYDRSGREAVPYVQVEPYDPDVVRRAVWWLEEVVAAFLAGEEATKEPPREMCAVACGFFSVCRAFDTDVEGLIKEPKYLEAIDMYEEGKDLVSTGKRLQNSAKIILKGVEGHTPDYALRWTHVSGSEVHYVQSDYLKMQLTKKRKGK